MPSVVVLEFVDVGRYFVFGSRANGNSRYAAIYCNEDRNVSAACYAKAGTNRRRYMGEFNIVWNPDGGGTQLQCSSAGDRLAFRVLNPSNSKPLSGWACWNLSHGRPSGIN